MGIAAIVCIAIVVLAIVIVLTILVYNQMLLLNETNKRLLLLTKEAIDKERMTQEELQEALINIEQMSNAGNPDLLKTPSENNPEFIDADLDI